MIVDLAEEKPAAKGQVDLKNILGYLNQGEWTSKLSIGSVMQLQPYKFKDLIEEGQNELELTRESFIQKVSQLCVSYFCYSTEIRFIIQMREDMSFDTPAKQKESEYWHAKALEISCTFLPCVCPLLNHINVSYQKHFAPVKTTIKENEKQEDNLIVIKPLNGVENNKFQPIVRQLDNIKVAITPFQMTPLHRVTDAVIQQMQSYNDYTEQHPSSLNDNMLGQLNQKSIDEEDEEPGRDDLQKLESIFKRLIGSGKVSRKAVVQKLIDVCGTQTEEVSVLARLANNQKEEADGLDMSINSENRLVATEDQRHRHKVSNTNSNFYKFRQNPDRLAQAAQNNERPKSSKGGLRSSANSSHHQSVNESRV